MRVMLNTGCQRVWKKNNKNFTVITDQIQRYFTTNHCIERKWKVIIKSTLIFTLLITMKKMKIVCMRRRNVSLDLCVHLKIFISSGCYFVILFFYMFVSEDQASKGICLLCLKKISKRSNFLYLLASFFYLFVVMSEKWIPVASSYFTCTRRMRS